MLKWAKVINEETKEVKLGVGVNPEYYASIGMTEMEVEEAYTGVWYVKGYAPQKPEPTHEEIIKEQIIQLEAQVTSRNIRAALLGDSFAINKITDIEAQIEELRKQLIEANNL